MGCCVVEKQLSFECIISALAQTSLGFISGWGREVALLEGRNVAEAIDAATNYPPSSKGGSRAATSGDEKMLPRTMRILNPMKSSSSPFFLRNNTKEGNVAWLFTAVSCDFSSYQILLTTARQRQRDGGTRFMEDINSKLINGRRDMQYTYICNRGGNRTTPRAAASLAIHPRFIVHRRWKSNSGQLN